MEFSEYYVAYFDVLGYKETFKKSEDFCKKIVESIEFSIDLMKKIVPIVNASLEESIDEKNEIEYRIFSDNVLIYRKKREYLLSELDLVTFLRLVAIIQRVFFEGSLLIAVRGGITKGPLYLTKDFVGGKALIDAVELEKNAVYPRIVVDDCILSELNLEKQNDVLKNIIATRCQDLLIKHTDNKFCLNYIISYDPWICFPKNDSKPENIESFEEVEKNYREGCLRKPIYNPKCLEEIFAVLRNHNKFVEDKINEFSQSSNDAAKEANRLHILKKYLWLASFHNKICDEMYKMPQLKIHLKSEFNEQTLAFDVSVG